MLHIKWMAEILAPFFTMKSLRSKETAVKMGFR